MCVIPFVLIREEIRTPVGRGLLPPHLPPRRRARPLGAPHPPRHAPLASPNRGGGICGANDGEVEKNIKQTSQSASQPTLL